MFLATNAKKHGYDIYVACRIRQHKKEIEKHGIKVINLAICRGSTSLGKNLIELLQFITLFFRIRPDILYFLALRPVFVGGLAASFLRYRNAIFSFAGFGHLFINERRFGLKLFLLKTILPIVAGSGKCLVENQNDRSFLKTFGISDNKIEVLPGSGVNLEDFRPVNETKNISGPPIVMMACRLIWPKGVGVFAEAAKKIQKWGCLARFVLVGEPDPHNPESVPVSIIKKWEDDGIFKWLGAKTDMNNILQQADIFCLPTSYREGMPKVLLEAMACGLPCITTNTRGCNEAVRHEENGLLVPPDDPQALALAIRKLVESPELRQKLGKAGRRIAEIEYNEKIVCNRTMEIFKEMLKRNHQQASLL